MDLLADVQAYIERQQLLEPGDGVVVGVSGGPDSVALLDVLRRLAEPLALHLHVGHLHHGMRGADADADAAFVAALAERWGLPCTVDRRDVPALAAREHLAPEEAARRARYAFLGRVAQEVGARKIAVGHNADDQAETVLMHLLRGAGLAGLRGMLPSRRLREYRLLPDSHTATEIALVRPLLGTPRAAIEAHCAARELAPRFDRSNLDTTFFRNRLRHEVLPYLDEVSPRVGERLRNLAEVARADYDLMQEFVSVAWDTLLIAAHGDAFVFDQVGWRGQPLAVRRGLVRRAAYRLRRTLRDVDFGHVDEAARVAQAGETGARATLPRDLQLTVGYTTITIGDRGALHLPPELPWLDDGAVVPTAIPGTTPLPGEWRLHARRAPHWNFEAIINNPHPLVAWMDADTLGESPILRTRRPGDRFRPQGMGGAEVRLSDFLINNKVPRRWRDHLPLLEADGHILWVVGLRLSEAALVREDTRHVVYLRFRNT